MDVLIALLTGALAFIGAVFGHFVAFDLNTAAKRRDIIRNHIERYAELISKDEAWLSDYKNALLFGKGKSSTSDAPHSEAYALFIMYFQSRLSEPMLELIKARSDYEAAIDGCWAERLTLAKAKLQANAANPVLMTAEAAISVSILPKSSIEKTQEFHGPYYLATLKCIKAASVVAHETIPEKSQIVQWGGEMASAIKRRISPRG